MRIVSYNIKQGGLKREEAILQSLRAAEPEIVILQEAIHPHVIAALAGQLDFPYFDCIQGSSVAFLSKIPPVNYRWHQRQGIKAPFLELDIKTGLKIYGIHLTALLSKWSERKRVYELHQLIQIIAQQTKTPHLLIGDMNTIARGDNVILAQMPLWLQIIIYISGGICTAVIFLERIRLEIREDNELWPALPSQTPPVSDNRAPDECARACKPLPASA